MSGKGDKRRRQLVDDKTVKKNWDRVFKKKKQEVWTQEELDAAKKRSDELYIELGWDKIQPGVHKGEEK